MVTIRHTRGVQEKRLRENFLGSAGTGASGDVNRIYTLTTVIAVAAVEVYRDGVLLTKDTQYTYDSINKQVTFLIPVWDNQWLSVFYEG